MLTDAELLALAVEMRQAQNTYYRMGRTPDQLRRAKDLERRFDRAVEARQAPAGLPLFPAGGPDLAT